MFTHVGFSESRREPQWQVVCLKTDFGARMEQTRNKNCVLTCAFQLHIFKYRVALFHLFTVVGTVLN